MALLVLGVAGFVCGGLAFGAIFVGQLRSFAAGGTGIDPSLVVTRLLGGPSSNAAPDVAPTGGTAPSLPVYSDSHRLTILLLGIDQRQDEAAQHIPSRTDTMIVLTVDPQQKKAALISIPRDLVVPIPGHGDQKINTAHFWGEVDHRGGGPALAVETVESNFGIHVDYYARVDFLAFERLIDAIGGIDVDVQRPILDDAYPTPDYGIMRLYIPAGPQWMDGARALEYARSRHSANDFARQARQRAVILAAEQKALQPRMLVELPRFVGILRESVGTDIPFTELPALVSLARSIPAQNIVDVGITSGMVIDVHHDGTELLPDQPKIQQLFARVFEDTTPVQPPTAPVATAPTTAPRSPVHVEVTNGTERDGLAARTADELKGKGYVIAGVAQANLTNAAHTIVVDRTGARHAGQAIAQAIGVPASAVQDAPARPDLPDVTVILGDDAPGP